MTKEIRLKWGAIAIVDDEDYDRINRWRWYLSKEGYAYRNTSFSDEDGMRRNIQTKMHRDVMRKTLADYGITLEVDHINGNKLDNRKSNLRYATRAQNSYNRRPSKNSSSIYKGVSRQGDKWIALIARDGKRYNLGKFEDEQQAAIAYDAKAKELFGEYAWLNFPEQPRTK